MKKYIESRRLFLIGMLILVCFPVTVNYTSVISGAGIAYAISAIFLIPATLFRLSLDKKYKIYPAIILVIIVSLYRNSLGIGTLTLFLIVALLSNIRQAYLEDFKKIIGIIMIGSIPLAIYQSITNTWPILDDVAIEGFGKADHYSRAAGFVGHPIPYGIAFGAIALMYYYRQKYLFVALSLFGVLLTQSRTAIISIAVIILLEIAIRSFNILKRKKIKVTNIIMIIPVAIIFVSAFLAFSNSDRYSNVFGSYSAKYRRQQFEILMNQISHSSIENQILGNGANTSEDFIKSSFHYGLISGPPTFDNSILTILFEYGYLGIIIVLSIVIYTILKNRSLIFIYLIICSISFDAYKWPIYIILCVIYSYDSGSKSLVNGSGIREKK